ncbi:MAG: antitoxin [Spirochaetales bacterium]|nr:antitoxin [Spirochaetales bacterium]
MSRADELRNSKLDPEEQWYEDNFDDFDATSSEVRESLVRAAQLPPKIISTKKQMVSIRLDPTDLQVLKEKAERAGLPYQTMVAALLHQYALGDLVNIEEARKILRVS